MTTEIHRRPRPLGPILTLTALLGLGLASVATADPHDGGDGGGWDRHDDDGRWGRDDRDRRDDDRRHGDRDDRYRGDRRFDADDQLVFANRWHRPVIFAVQAGRDGERRPDVLLRLGRGGFGRFVRTGPVRPGARVAIDVVGDWARDRNGVIDERIHVVVLDARTGRAIDHDHRTVVLRADECRNRGFGHGTAHAWAAPGHGYGGHGDDRGRDRR